MKGLKNIISEEPQVQTCSASQISYYGSQKLNYNIMVVGDGSSDKINLISKFAGKN